MDKIKIKIPAVFIPEIQYAAGVIFEEFLGLECTFEIKQGNITAQGSGDRSSRESKRDGIRNGNGNKKDNGKQETNGTLEKRHEQDYEILLPGQKTVIIKNAFFSRFAAVGEGGSLPAYLKKENIPARVAFVKNRFTIEEDIPVIYGSDELEVSSRQIFCGIDIFASVFFMLSRWEEFADDSRDSHGRFPAEEALALRSGFLERPVVNEMAGMLANMLRCLGCEVPGKYREVGLVPTHDVDYLGYPFFIRRLAGDILKRRNVKQAWKRLQYMFAIEKPYLCFDFLMDMSERYRLVSRFYFTHRGKHGFDGDYAYNDREFLRQVENIKKRGHIIGYHPSYHAFTDAQLFAEEKHELEAACGMPITEGRHHYLRFAVPYTWQAWEEQGMVLDSSVGYSAQEGFRCGTGNAYPVFNILSRRKLALRERPLVIMDTTLNMYRGLSAGQSLEIFNKYKGIAGKYCMPVTILLHNSSFEEVEWQGWKAIAPALLNPAL